MYTHEWNGKWKYCSTTLRSPTQTCTNLNFFFQDNYFHYLELLINKTTTESLPCRKAIH